MTEVGLILLFSNVGPVSQPGRQMRRCGIIRHSGGIGVQLRQKIVRIQSTKSTPVARPQQCCEPPGVIVFEKTRDFVASADFEQEKLGNRLLLRASADHRKHSALAIPQRDLPYVNQGA